MRSKISVRDFTLALRLGCGEAERSVPQRVSFGWDVHFTTLPKACLTDSIEDAVCYAELCELVRRETRREFRTVEYLAAIVHAAIKEVLPRDTHLDLRVRKMDAPVEGLKGGFAFEIAESEISA